MAPARGITVRLGSVVAHVGSVAKVVDLMFRLSQVGRPLSDSGGEMADVATGIMQAGVVSSQVLEAETLAKGIAKVGRDLPNSLKRELRQLDAATAFLRHPRSAARLVNRLCQWSGKALIPDGVSGADSSESTDAAKASQDSSVAKLKHNPATSSPVSARTHGERPRRHAAVQDIGAAAQDIAGIKTHEPQAEPGLQDIGAINPSLFWLKPCLAQVLHKTM